MFYWTLLKRNAALTNQNITELNNVEMNKSIIGGDILQTREIILKTDR